MKYALAAGGTVFDVGTTKPTYNNATKTWMTGVGKFVDPTGMYSLVAENDELSPVVAPLAGSVVTASQFLTFWTAQELAAISGLATKSGLVENFFVGTVGAGKVVDMTDIAVQKTIRMIITLIPVDIIPLNQQNIRFRQIISAQVA